MTPAEIETLPYRPCVGVMLVNGEGKAFTGQRIDNHQDAWQMPQGGVDPGEDPEDAAFRELWEETGVARGNASLIARTKDWIPYDLPHDLIPKIWGGKYRGQNQLWYLFKYNGDGSDITIETEQPEFREWSWMDIGKLPEKIVPFKRHTYEQVIAELSPYIDWV